MGQRYDLVIIGMGSGGMVAAEFAATLGVRVAVVERGRVGGDCLWTGCVPSKALLASAKVAHHMRTADRYGLPSVEPEIDLGLVWKRIRAIQQEIAATDDNPDRFEQAGVEIVRGTARLTGANTVDVEGRALDTRFVLLCTGSRPAAPAISGLADAGYVTSEDLFELEKPPRSFVMVGGGPIAMEMAQGFNRLGIRVTVLQKGPRILPRDEPALVDILVQKLREEKLDLRFDVETERVSVEDGTTKVVHGTEAGRPGRWAAEELLVAVGRRPNVEGLGLEEIGVGLGPRGIEVDNRMRTKVASVYACGDVAGRFLFTHAAGYEGVRAVRDMFFPGKGKVRPSVPWCTFTDPELAHAGLTIAEAEDEHGHDEVEVWRLDLAHNDRARTEGAEEGAIVIVTAKKKIVGAHILAPAAGEMIHELALAIDRGLKLADVAGSIHVYPTVATGIGQLAGEAAFEGAKKFRWLVRRQK